MGWSVAGVNCWRVQSSMPQANGQRVRGTDHGTWTCDLRAVVANNHHSRQAVNNWSSMDLRSRNGDFKLLPLSVGRVHCSILFWG